MTLTPSPRRAEQSAGYERREVVVERKAHRREEGSSLRQEDKVQQTRGICDLEA